MKNLLKKYSVFILKVLAPLGPWGVFAVTALDAAALGLPVDVIVAGYVYERPSWLLIYVLMAAVGSALGSLIVYFIGRTGEEMVLEKRISRKRIEEIRARFQRQEFFALMVPAILPPPTPFKLFVLSAGVFHMQVRDFLLAVFTGRVLRFLAVALLTRFLGPEIVHVAGSLFHQHFWLSLLVIAAIALVAGLLWRKPWRSSRGKWGA